MIASHSMPAKINGLDISWPEPVVAADTLAIRVWPHLAEAEPECLKSLHDKLTPAKKPGEPAKPRKCLQEWAAAVPWDHEKEDVRVSCPDWIELKRGENLSMDKNNFVAGKWSVSTHQNCSELHSHANYAALLWNADGVPTAFRETLRDAERFNWFLVVHPDDRVDWSGRVNEFAPGYWVSERGDGMGFAYYCFSALK